MFTLKKNLLFDGIFEILRERKNRVNVPITRRVLNNIVVIIGINYDERYNIITITGRRKKQAPPPGPFIYFYSQITISNFFGGVMSSLRSANRSNIKKKKIIIISTSI